MTDFKTPAQARTALELDSPVALANSATQPADLVPLVDAIDVLEARPVSEGSGEPVRPGDFPLDFAGQLVGVINDLIAVPGQVVTDSDIGQSVQVSEASIVALRQPIAVLPGRIYEARWVFKRTVNSADPLGDAIAAGIQYLNGSQAAVSAYASAQNPAVSNGVWIVPSVTFSLDVAGVDVTIPAGTKYVRPYAQTYGSTATSRIGWIIFADITTSATSDDVAAAEAAAAAAAAAALATAADVLEIAGDAAVVASAAIAALSSQTTALAAANASGPAIVFATKALADAGLAGLAADAVVEVSVDESKTDRRSRYRKTAGAYVFELDLTGRRKIYLDAINGDDANTGLSAFSAKLTWSAAESMLADGDDFRIARNSVVYGSSFANKKDLSWRPFGAGRRPIFTSAKEIPAVSWTLVSGDIYKATVVHDVATVGSSDASFYCNFAMWDDLRDSMLPARISGLDRILTGINTGGGSDGTGNVVLAVDLAALVPNSFTVRRTGFDDTNPFTVSATSFDYYVRLKDGANPATMTGRKMQYAEARTTTGIGYGCDVEGIDFLRSASKDHVSGGTGNGSVGRIHDCRMIDFSVHGSVLRGCDYTKVYVEKNPYSSNGQAGWGLHLYRFETIDGIMRGAWIDDVEVVGALTGIGMHGATDDIAFDQWELGNIRMKGCNTGLFVQEVVAPVHVRSLHMSGSLKGKSSISHRGALAASGSSVIIDDFSFYADEDYVKDNFVFSGDITVHNGRSNTTSSSSSAVFAGDGTILLNNYTHTGGPATTTTFSDDVNVVMNNCIMTDFATSPSSLIAENSMLVMSGLTLLEVQALYSGVSDTCLTPFFDQPYSRTLTSGDEVSLDRGTVTIISGAAFMLATRDDLVNNGNCRIAGADGSGGLLGVNNIARDAANDSGGEFAYTAGNIATFPASVSSAVITRVSMDRSIFPNSAGTAWLPRNQDHIVVSDITQYTVGQYIRLGGFAGRKDFGLFKVSALPGGSQVQLTENVPWRLAPVSGGVSYPSSTNPQGTNPANPVVSVSFGFPINTAYAGGSGTGVAGVITYAAGGSLAFTDGRSSQTGRLTPILAGVGGTFGGDYTNPELGIFDVDVAAGADDTVTLAARIIVDEFYPEFAATLHERLPLLTFGSELAKRKMGWRFLGYGY